MPIIGREKELEILEEVYESSESQFLAVYGRRRIGKTYIVSEYFKDKGVYFEITGMKEGSTKEQLFQFGYEFARQFNDGKRIPSPSSWAKAFNLLNDAIEKVPKDKKIILFFDEVPWLATPRSRFLNSLEHFWNRYASRHSNVVLIICGSSASWIIRNIINNKGGLYGRVTRKIRLLPFTLKETEDYLKSKSIDLDRKQIIDIYMAMGGVPKYLSYIKRGKSAAQIINEACFTLNGNLFDEFDNLFKSLFDNYEYHIAIVKALSNAHEGLSKDEILKKVMLSSGGASSKIIEELVDAGFIIYLPTFKKNKSGGIYRLIDEYSLFYLTWINECSNAGFEGVDAEYWMKKYGSPKWPAWSGSAFESICFKHIQKIKSALGISAVVSIESGWKYVPEAEDERGTQIDLIIDRSDRCINICEMKFSDSEFVIDKSYVDNLRNKKQIFRDRTGTKKTIFTTMVTTYGVKKNSHYLSVVDNQLTMDDLFY